MVRDDDDGVDDDDVDDGVDDDDNGAQSISSLGRSVRNLTFVRYGRLSGRDS